MNGPTSYVELLNSILIEKDLERDIGNPLRPSNAGACARRIAHEFAGFLGLEEIVKEKRKPSVLRLLNLGHFIESQVVEDFKDMPAFKVKYTQQEVDIFTLPFGTEVTGHTDLGIFADGVAGILDVKSMGDRWEAAFVSKWEKLIAFYSRLSCVEHFGEDSFWVEDLGVFLEAIGTDDSLYKNLVQLNLYACCDFLKKKRVDHGSIIRYNKNNSKLMEIRFKPSQEVFNKTEDRFKLIESACQHEDVKLVPKERVLGSTDCAYCLYRPKCWPKASREEIYAGSPKKKWAIEAADISEAFAFKLSQYQVVEEHSFDKDELEKAIILDLDQAGVSKVKLGKVVYEVKHLKSGSVLRRGKE